MSTFLKVLLFVEKRFWRFPENLAKFREVFFKNQSNVGPPARARNLTALCEDSTDFCLCVACSAGILQLSLPYRGPP